MSYRKMTEGDVVAIVEFLESYRSDENVIRWQDVEAFSKFTRQALNAHPKIKAAYRSAKDRLADARQVESSPAPVCGVSAEIAEEMESLRKKIAVLEHQQVLWRRRWYCIAYHIRQQGIQMFNVDRPVPIGSPPLSEKEVRRLLEDFDQDIPPVASHRSN